MTVHDIKKSLHLSIDKIKDEHFLKAVYAMVTSFQDKEIIGSLGKVDLTRSDILNRELEADADIKAGRVHTQHQIKKSLGLK